MSASLIKLESESLCIEFDLYLVFEIVFKMLIINKKLANEAKESLYPNKKLSFQESKLVLSFCP